MKLINYFYSFIILVIIVLTCFLSLNNNETFNSATEVYKIYLKGQEVGLIENDKELYSLINHKQKGIKNEFDVDNVYPPSEFNIVKTNSFNNNFDSVEEIYNTIEKEEDFTIEGYIITAKKEDGTEVVINVTKREVFDEAIQRFVYSFVGDNSFNDYLEGTQESIELTGDYIEAMYFAESISIKEGFVSVKDKIFKEADELIQYLLFGEDKEIQTYRVQLGDSIESISEKYAINTKEFLVANPEYRSEEALLKVDTDVNITVLNPVLDMVVEHKKYEDVEQKFVTTTAYDSTKPSNYSEITQAGVNGITRTTQRYLVVNGEASPEVKISDSIVIRDTVEQIVTKGSRTGWVVGTYVDNGLDWGWATKPHYKITSYFGTRGRGEFHNAIDISGTGYGSPIYAIGDGIVTQAAATAQQRGTYIVIDHGNNYYSSYLHLKSFKVKPGQVVKRGEHIGAMGNTGDVRPKPTPKNPTGGTHLHLAFSEGEPYTGKVVKFIDPMKALYK